MSEWVTPGGGGGKLKFFAHKNNYTKHIVNLISHYITAKEHGDSVGDGVNDVFELKNMRKMELDTVITAVQIVSNNSHRDLTGNWKRWVDTIRVNVKLPRNPQKNKVKIDSVKRSNSSVRGEIDAWLNQ